MSTQPSAWSESELEVVSCANCGGGAARTVCLRPDHIPVVECRCCGLAYLSPRPRPSALPRLYERDYFVKERGSGEAIGYSDYLQKPARKDTRRRLDLLERHRSFTGASVLEIGCATGDLLAAVRARGAAVTGLDISRWAAATARQRHGIDVLVGTLDTLDDVLPAFDIVLALEVIEHVEDPARLLRQLARHLAPGGYTMISTPNYRCARRFGHRWAGFHRSLEHLYYLSDEVLSRMCAAAGLEEVVWYTTGYGLGPGTQPNGRRTRFRRLARMLPGAARALSLVRHATGDTRYVPYGQGHTLLAIFRKKARTANEVAESA